MIRYFLILLFVPFAHASFAQLEKVMHQTFSVSKDISSLNLDIEGEYVIEKWAGSSIMTETKVELYESSPAILNHFVEKEQRYLILVDTVDKTLRLHAHDKERDPIRRSKEKECPEIVNLKIFVPEDFESTGEENKIFTRKEVSSTEE